MALPAVRPPVFPMSAAILSPSTAPVKRNHTIGPPVIHPPSVVFQGFLSQLPALPSAFPQLPRLNTVPVQARPPAPVDTTPVVISGISTAPSDFISFDKAPLPSLPTSTGGRPRDIFDSPVMMPDARGESSTAPIPIPLPADVVRANPLLAASQPVLLNSNGSSSFAASPASPAMMSNHSASIPALLPPFEQLPMTSLPYSAMPTLTTFTAPQPAVFAAPQPATFATPQSPAFTFLQPEAFTAPQQAAYTAPQQAAFTVPQPAAFVAPQPTAFAAYQPQTFIAPQPATFAPPQPTAFAAPAPQPVAYTAPQVTSVVQQSTQPTQVPQQPVSVAAVENTTSAIYTVHTDQASPMVPVTTPVGSTMAGVNPQYSPMLMSTTPPAPAAVRTSTTVLTASNVYRVPMVGVKSSNEWSAAPVSGVQVVSQQPMYQYSGSMTPMVVAQGQAQAQAQAQGQAQAQSQAQAQTQTQTQAQGQAQAQTQAQAQAQAQAQYQTPGPQLNLVPAMNHPVAVVPEQTLPNYEAMPMEQQAQHRATFVTKFGILRSSWQSMGIPDINWGMSLREIHSMYNMYVQQIHIQQNVDSYKQYMVAIWWILELLGSKAGLNITGYAQSQMNSMSKYEKLLIELGENKYKETAAVNGGVIQVSQWPVELRLLGVALLNALIFVIVRTCVSYLGMDGNVVQQVLGFFSGNSNSPAIAQIAQQAVQGNNPNNNTPAIPDPPMPNQQGGLGGMLGTLLPGFLGNMFGGGQAGNTPGGANAGLAGLVGQLAGAMMGPAVVQQPQQAQQPIIVNNTPPPVSTPTSSSNGARQRRTPQFAY